MRGFDRVWLHAGQRPAAVDARLGAALAEGRLPPRLLYDSHAQAGRWLRYHDAWSPARLDPEVEALYPTVGGRKLNGRPLVSLGCGSGHKDRAISKAGGARSYFAVDTSVALAAGSAAAASEAGLDARAVVMDLEAPGAREAFGKAPVVFVALGLVPNFELSALASALKTLLRPGDGLMVSANLGAAEDPEILAQYDNPEARSWMMGGLIELGLEPAALSVEVRGRGLDSVLSRVECRVRLRQEQPLRLPFFEDRWRAGFEFLAFFSQRLLRSGAAQRLSQALGLDLVDTADTAVEGVYWFEV
ncbi:MAG: methyltransferase domain-containing protein [Myxococcota bacterium]